MTVSWDDKDIRKLPHEERLIRLEEIAKNDPDESARWDVVWMLGELAEETNLKGPAFEKAGKLLAWMLKNDENSIVRHEVSYQLAGRGYHKHIPDMVESAIHDESPLVRHESCECLAIINAVDSKPHIEKLLHDPEKIVKETAQFVLKRMERRKNKGYDRMENSF
ncbi:PBS lyase [Nitrosopumilus sp. b3]|uniref:HEAT repeat domain-containing protein n=1 Tax=Nitrosopumilus sp. b3 TaxID=2109909 RepID=UPI0015F4C013|nr:HEAT repeat domain-containing protein [Nitrosopumilus sp. b3]KAF6247385.1 PBS lyase [Nitrosopumilus sp. b3]